MACYMVGVVARPHTECAACRRKRNASCFKIAFLRPVAHNVWYCACECLCTRVISINNTKTQAAAVTGGLFKQHTLCSTVAFERPMVIQMLVAKVGHNRNTERNIPDPVLG